MEALLAAERSRELADEAFAALDLDAVITHLSAAVRGFTDGGDARRAGLACARLGDALSLLGQFTPGKVWYARAERLVVDLPPCVEQGWVAVSAMGCEVDDPTLLLARAELALDRARRFGDLDLEAKALADGGLAHVQIGDVDVGMAMLDEAMALVCVAEPGPVAGKSVCSFYTACYHSADVERFGTWSESLRKYGLVGSAPGAPVYLSSHCDLVQAALLVELGRWGEADALLQRSIDEFEAAMGGMPSWHPAIGLADLRTLQGRCTDAEVLLLGKEQTPQALLPAARVHLARGDHRLAIATATRGLRALGEDRLRAVELLLVAVESHLALGEIDAARQHRDDLLRRVTGIPVATLRARAAIADARVEAAAGDAGAALAIVDEALDGLDSGAVPWRTVQLLIERARLEHGLADAAAARTTALAAGALLEGLDVVISTEDAALLERLAGARPSPGPRASAALSCEGGWWTASCGGTSVRLKDTKGLRYVAELICSAGQERHALDLVDRVEGLGAIDRRALGDAGPIADTAARSAYRHRIEALRADIDEAVADGHDDTAAALQVELDHLVTQLAQAFGLGGRERIAGSAAEKARLNVTRALRGAIAKLTEALPQAGAVLDRRVRTGLYCSYVPDAADEISWIVQPPVNGTASG